MRNSSKFLVTLLLLLFVGAANAQVTSEKVKVKKGKVLTLRLKSNPTTGYSWLQVKSDSSKGLDSLKVIFERPKSSRPGLTGASGVEVWRFKAVQKGSYMLTFIYKRPWENAEPEHTAIYRVTVY